MSVMTTCEYANSIPAAAAAAADDGEASTAHAQCFQLTALKRRYVIDLVFLVLVCLSAVYKGE